MDMVRRTGSDRGCNLFGKDSRARLEAGNSSQPAARAMYAPETRHLNTRGGQESIAGNKSATYAEMVTARRDGQLTMKLSGRSEATVALERLVGRQP